MSDAPDTVEKAAPFRRSWSFDRVASIFALGLSIAALLVSLVEVSTVRTQQRATAWPHIALSQSYSANGFQLEVTNKGVGPALMGDVVLKKDGAPIADLDQLILETLGPEDAFSYDLYRSSDPSNSVIAAGETAVLFAVPWEPRTRKLVSAWGRSIDIETCYCSIHEDCWQVSLSQARTQKTRSCETGISS